MTDHLCIVCLVYGRDPRPPMTMPVCDSCRERIRRELVELPDAYARLSLLPGQAQPGERVSGSREAPLPLAVEPLDLTMPARLPNPTAAARRFPNDQSGRLSVASVLDSWVRDWREVRVMRESAPEPTVPVLVGWLNARLDWALDHYAAVDEFAAEVSDLVRTLRRMTGTDRLVHRLSAPCPTCDLTELHREDGASFVECRHCRRLWTEEEYHRLCVIAAAEAKVRARA